MHAGAWLTSLSSRLRAPIAPAGILSEGVWWSTALTWTCSSESWRSPSSFPPRSSAPWFRRRREGGGRRRRWREKKRMGEETNYKEFSPNHYFPNHHSLLQRLHSASFLLKMTSYFLSSPCQSLSAALAVSALLTAQHSIAAKLSGRPLTSLLVENYRELISNIVQQGTRNHRSDSLLPYFIARNWSEINPGTRVPAQSQPQSCSTPLDTGWLRSGETLERFKRLPKGFSPLLSSK